MPPQTTEDLSAITGPPESERLAKPMMKMTTKRPQQQQQQPQSGQSGLMRIVSSLFGSLITFLNINWLLGFFGLVLVKLDNADEVPLNKRKNEDLVENEMKRLKSERGCDDEEENKMELMRNKSNLITDFTNKLWNLTPNINFSEDSDVETFLPVPKKVITPTKSFDNLVNLGLSEPETGPVDQLDLEGEETDVMEEVEEVEEIINYNAEASYRVQVTSLPEMDQQAEKPKSEEQQTVETVLDTDTISKGTDLTSGEEAEIVEIVLDPDTICKVTELTTGEAVVETVLEQKADSEEAETDLDPETILKATSEEEAETVLDPDTNFKVTSAEDAEIVEIAVDPDTILQSIEPTSGEEAEIVEIVLDPDTILKVTKPTSGEETEKADSEEPEIVETVLDPEREKERVDDEAAEELLVKKKEEDAVFTENNVPSSEIKKKVVSERMEAEVKESDKFGAGVRRNSKGKNRGGNKGKKKKEKM